MTPELEKLWANPPNWREVTIRCPERRLRSSMMDNTMGTPQPMRDPHRSTTLMLMLTVDTAMIVDLWEAGYDLDVRARTRELLIEQVDMMLDEMLEQGRSKVKGHP